MEATAYAELKSSRDTARKTRNNYQDTLRHLKCAALSAPTEQIRETITADREALKANYGAVKIACADLEAQVTKAREEYRAAKFTAPEADDLDDEEDDLDW